MILLKKMNQKAPSATSPNPTNHGSNAVAKDREGYHSYPFQEVIQRIEYTHINNLALYFEPEKVLKISNFQVVIIFKYFLHA